MTVHTAVSKCLSFTTANSTPPVTHRQSAGTTGSIPLHTGTQRRRKGGPSWSAVSSPYLLLLKGGSGKLPANHALDPLLLFIAFICTNSAISNNGPLPTWSKSPSCYQILSLEWMSMHADNPSCIVSCDTIAS